MAQRTVVVKLDPTRGRELRSRLESAGFEFRGVPHAAFSAKSAAGVLTLYKSGKLVVQGSEPEDLLARHLPDYEPAAEKPEVVAPQPGGPVLGSDESGKGDYFGPLVVAAVRLDAAAHAELSGSQVRDSKRLDDATCLRLGAALRARYPHAIARLDPPEYNAEHLRVRNLNPMLAALHGRAIRELASEGMHVVVDQFARAGLMEAELRGANVKLEQRPRAEEIPAVAAASIVAREQFLLALQELSGEWALDLVKGAGPPVDRAARRFVQLHGLEPLGQVAKLHFKNTLKLGTSSSR